MTQKIGFNREKLRRFMIKNSDLQAAYLKLHEDIDFLTREQIPTFERRLTEASEKAELNNNREIFNARNEGRDTSEFKNFLDCQPDEMLTHYQNHPIKNFIDFGVVQKYVRYKREIDSLRAHQKQISAELAPRSALVSRSLDFLKNQGLTNDDIGLGVE